MSWCPIRTAEGRPERQQLIQGQAQPVDVGPGVTPAFPRNRSGAM